jgi:hypothetical protein
MNVEAQDPDPQRLMMAGEDGVGQVIEARLTGRAAVTLTLRLPVIMTMPGHLVTRAYRATHALGPPQTPDRLEALGVIDQELKVDQTVHRPVPSLLVTDPPRTDKSIPSGIIRHLNRWRSRLALQLSVHHPETRIEPKYFDAI